MTDFEIKVLELLGDINEKLRNIETHLTDVSNNTDSSANSLENLEQTVKVIEKQTQQ